MGVEPTIDVTTKQREAILAMLNRYLPNTEVWAYGSRVKWTSRPSSDLDLVIFSAPEQSRRVSDLREAFEESNLPFRVDLFVWNDLPEGFRPEIEREYVVLTDASTKVGKFRTERLGDCIKMNEVTYSPKEAWSFANYLDTESITENGIEKIQHLVLSRENLPSRARRKAVAGDIVYSMVRPIQKHFGLLRKVPENFLVSTDFTVFRGNEDIADTQYIYWVLSQDHIVEQLQTIAEHSTWTCPSIKPSDIADLNIPLPSIPEQRHIAQILGTLDDRIELNKRNSNSLEALVRAIFSDWFVDFGPTRAKMQGSAPYLTQELWDLFPNKLNDEDKPSGWSSCKVSQLIEFNPHESIMQGASAPYLDMAALPTVGLVADMPQNKIYKSGSKFRDGDTLFARITPCLENGKTAYVSGLGDGVVGWGSSEFIVMRSRSSLLQPISYLLARDPDFRAHAERNMTGTSGKQRVNVETLADYEVSIPPDERLWFALSQITKPIMESVVANAYMSRTLSQIHNLLLPNLISGEIRLREFKQIAEETV